MAPALCVLEFTYLLIRQSPVLTTGRSCSRPALPDRGPGAATRAFGETIVKAFGLGAATRRRQTNPISRLSGLKTGVAALERQFDHDRRLGARVDER